MTSSILNLKKLRTATPIGFSWFVVVFLVAWQVPVTRSVGQEIQYLEGQESEFVVMERNPGNFQVQPGFSYHYDPHNRREPFLPLVIPQDREVSSSSMEESRTQRPTWKLLGIISGRLGNYASIQNSEGKRYIVASGSVIPSQGLIVKRITKTKGLTFSIVLYSSRRCSRQDSPAPVPF